MEEDYQLDQGTGGISPRELYMVKLGLGICKIVEQKLQNDEKHQNLLMLVKEIKDFVNDENIFESLNQIELTYQEYVILKKECMDLREKKDEEEQ